MRYSAIQYDTDAMCFRREREKGREIEREIERCRVCVCVSKPVSKATHSVNYFNNPKGSKCLKVKSRQGCRDDAGGQ